MIQARVHKKLWKPIKVSRKGPAISHLFFADDLMFFAQASQNQVELIREVLTEFANASGLVMNLSKSKLFVSPNVPRQTMNLLSSLCGIPLTDDLGIYFGVPIIQKRASKDHYARLIDKVRNRLSSWKRNVLSSGDET